MQATLLGTSDAYGVPAPLCDCEYCQESQPRRRPAAVVQAGKTTLLLDAGPDTKEQLQEAGIYDLDTIYLTHHHFDHVIGLSDLYHITLEDNYLNSEEFEHPTHGKDLLVKCPGSTVRKIDREQHHVTGGIDFQPIAPGQVDTRGRLSVSPVPVAHGNIATYGYVVTDEKTEQRLVYAPDMAGWRTSGDRHVNPDALIIEGAEIVGPELHGETEQVANAIRTATGDQTDVFLVNVSEHTAELHTDALRRAGEPYTVPADFTRVL